ncbi:MAG: hypothetical protein A3E98_03105 [Candidatus Doudnabacteria bacterium RIFCSPHIGHO2_12_FULL_48_11]|uniref:Uncharacterized protein n=1 Tax=Candidatus Doudnabacteria bacterium RIFCSPHIGHO2_01_FULL_46_24 TaxID=1817825 RepID=A0A1F5NVY8_9BACT|nr:MAG: hypothetical protein A2720_03235 [Candidatus Doudnabacteria bacterium RIFCSPHIGHO2_01_FULL_46_24]OGE96028.1 MAG: hypothetical protein A3E98_03105 [Candidatus Doudnabacteria bacterium RIFCSPHIGHO2_12_FULL_48_11]
MKNRAHRETEYIISEVLNGPPMFSISLLIYSIDKFFNNELSITAENKQTGLLFMGIHAAALTISEALWGLHGQVGYQMFLEKFLDEEQPDREFSKIAKPIHDWRNILAHQFLSSSGHNFDYDYHMEKGYKINNKDLIINPSIYLSCYLRAFKDNRIMNYASKLNKKEQEKIKQRILGKYLQK